MSDFRIDFAELLSDKIGACGDTAMVRDLPSLHSAWAGEVPLSAEFTTWYLKTFLGDQEALRVLRGVNAIRRCLSKWNQQRYEATGEPANLPEGLEGALKLAVLTAMYPSAFEVAVGATCHPANRVSRELIRLGASEELWRKKFL